MKKITILLLATILTACFNLDINKPISNPREIDKPKTKNIILKNEIVLENKDEYKFYLQLNKNKYDLIYFNKVKNETLLLSESIDSLDTKIHFRLLKDFGIIFQRDEVLIFYSFKKEIFTIMDTLLAEKEQNKKFFDFLFFNEKDKTLIFSKNLEKKFKVCSVDLDDKVSMEFIFCSELFKKVDSEKAFPVLDKGIIFKGILEKNTNKNEEKKLLYFFNIKNNKILGFEYVNFQDKVRNFKISKNKKYLAYEITQNKEDICLLEIENNLNITRYEEIYPRCLKNKFADFRNEVKKESKYTLTNLEVLENGNLGFKREIIKENKEKIIDYWEITGYRTIKIRKIVLDSKEEKTEDEIKVERERILGLSFLMVKNSEKKIILEPKHEEPHDNVYEAFIWDKTKKQKIKNYKDLPQDLLTGKSALFSFGDGIFFGDRGNLYLFNPENGELQKLSSNYSASDYIEYNPSISFQNFKLDPLKQKLSYEIVHEGVSDICVIDITEKTEEMCVQELFNRIDGVVEQRTSFLDLQWKDNGAFIFKALKGDEEFLYEVDDNRNIKKYKNGKAELRALMEFTIPTQLFIRPDEMYNERYMNMVFDSFYPIGRSKDGKYFAFFLKEGDEAKGFSIYDVIILDLERNEKITHNYNDIQDTEDGYSKQLSPQEVWKNNQNEISIFLKKYDIIQYENFKIKMGSINDSKIFTVKGVAADFNHTYSAKFEINILSEKQGIKTVMEGQQDYGFIDFYLLGYLENPINKNLPVFLSDKINKGYEGPPNTYNLSINSANTKKGFETNTKKKSRELNNLGMQFYSKFWEAEKEDIDRDDIWGCGFGDPLTDELLQKAERNFDLAYNVSELTEKEPYYQALYNKASIQALRFNQKEANKTIKKLLSFRKISQKYKKKIKEDSDFYTLSIDIENGHKDDYSNDNSYIDDFNYLLTGSKEHTLKYKEIKDWRYSNRQGICG